MINMPSTHHRKYADTSTQARKHVRMQARKHAKHASMPSTRFSRLHDSPEVNKSTKLKNYNNILPFVSTYNPKNSKKFPKVREIYGSLQTWKTLAKTFVKHKLIDCTRNPSNLKRLLSSSNFATNKQTFKTRKCCKSCFCCDYNIEGQLFKFKNWHQLFILKSNFNCDTPNPIYVILCSSCNEEYI